MMNRFYKALCIVLCVCAVVSLFAACGEESKASKDETQQPSTDEPTADEPSGDEPTTNEPTEPETPTEPEKPVEPEKPAYVIDDSPMWNPENYKMFVDIGTNEEAIAQLSDGRIVCSVKYKTDGSLYPENKFFDFQGSKIKQVAATKKYYYILTDEGRLFTLGIYSEKDATPYPAIFQSDVSYILHTDGFDVVIIKNDGGVWKWIEGGTKNAKLQRISNVVSIGNYKKDISEEYADSKYAVSIEEEYTIYIDKEHRLIEVQNTTNEKREIASDVLYATKGGYLKADGTLWVWSDGSAREESKLIAESLKIADTESTIGWEDGKVKVAGERLNVFEEYYINEAKHSGLYFYENEWNPEDYSKIMAMSDNYLMHSSENGKLYWRDMQPIKNMEYVSGVSTELELQNAFLGKYFFYVLPGNGVLCRQGYDSQKSSAITNIKSIIPINETSFAVIKQDNKLYVFSEYVSGRNGNPEHTDLALRGTNCKDFIYDAYAGYGYMLTYDGAMFEISNCVVTEKGDNSLYTSTQITSGVKKIISKNYVINDNDELIKIVIDGDKVSLIKLFDNVKQCVIHYETNETELTFIDTEGNLWRLKDRQNKETEIKKLAQKAKYIFAPAKNNPIIRYIDDYHYLWTILPNDHLVKTYNSVLYLIDGYDGYTFLATDGVIRYGRLSNIADCIYYDERFNVIESTNMPAANYVFITKNDVTGLEGMYQATAFDRVVYFPETKEAMTIHEWLERFSEEKGEDLEFTSFALMNGNAGIELVIAIGDRETYGQLILYYRDGKINAEHSEFRELMQIKTDGRCSFTSLTVEYGIREYYMHSDENPVWPFIVVYAKCYYRYRGEESRYIGLTECFPEECAEVWEAEFDAELRDFNSTPDVKWYDYNEENIEKYINCFDFEKDAPWGTPLDKKINPPTEDNGKWSSPEAKAMLKAYEKVIWGEETVINTNSGEEVYFISTDDSLSFMSAEPVINIVDFNKDGLPEVLVGVANYDVIGYRVLYSLDGKMYMDHIVYRGAQHVYDDHVFLASGGASHHYYDVYELTERGLILDRIAISTDEWTGEEYRDVYILYGEEVTKEEFDAFLDSLGEGVNVN